jgi:hypothetical protein
MGALNNVKGRVNLPAVPQTFQLAEPKVGDPKGAGGVVAPPVVDPNPNPAIDPAPNPNPPRPKGGKKGGGIGQALPPAQAPWELRPGLSLGLAQVDSYVSRRFEADLRLESLTDNPAAMPRRFLPRLI